MLKKIDHTIQKNIKHLNYAQQYDIGKRDHKIIKI
jgi:hypothetical protein